MIAHHIDADVAEIALAVFNPLIRRIRDFPAPTLAAVQGAASRTADYREGFAAFKSKRSPRFSGA